MDNYNPARDVTPAFLDRVAAWFQESGEALVVIRYLGGAKDFALCHSREDFEALVAAMPVGADIEVFRDPQLPMRGTIDEGILASAVDAIADGEEFLVLSMDTLPGSSISSRSMMGASNADLRESLDELTGKRVALGVCPNFCVGDHEGLASAAKGGIDGPR